MYSHETFIRVRYGETDQMGYMYYGNYAQFYEVGRVEMLRSLGLSYKSFERDGIMMPVLELNCKYLRPARYDDLIRVVTTLKEIPRMRIRFEYALYDTDNMLLNTGATVLVFVNMNSLKPCLPPAELITKLQSYFENGVVS
jgi:acyl-CoA thioester hydrolase